MSSKDSPLSASEHPGPDAPQGLEVQLALLTQNVKNLEVWFTRTFIASWAAIAVAASFLLYSYLPAQIKPITDQLIEVKQRLDKIDSRLEELAKPPASIARPATAPTNRLR